MIVFLTLCYCGLLFLLVNLVEVVLVVVVHVVDIQLSSMVMVVLFPVVVPCSGSVLLELLAM